MKNTEETYENDKYEHDEYDGSNGDILISSDVSTRNEVHPESKKRKSLENEKKSEGDSSSSLINSKFMY